MFWNCLNHLTCFYIIQCNSVRFSSVGSALFTFIQFGCFVQFVNKCTYSLVKHFGQEEAAAKISDRQITKLVIATSLLLWKQKEHSVHVNSMLQNSGLVYASRIVLCKDCVAETVNLKSARFFHIRSYCTCAYVYHETVQ